MVVDIHTVVEVRRDGGWRRAGLGEIFEHPDYRIFGFLAGVRNYSQSPVIAAPRGVPAGFDDAGLDELFGLSWLTLAELQAFDYDRVFTDRRGPAEERRLGDFLGGYFFERLDRLAALGPPADVRIVFGFDA